MQKPKDYLPAIFLVLSFGGVCLGQPAAETVSTSANLFGVTKSSEGTPLAGARVIVRHLADGTERVLESDASGAFAATDLKPGRYEVTANKDRLVSPPENHVELAANQSVRSDLTLTAGSEVPVIAATPSKGGFFTRFFQAYADDWKATDSSASTPAPALPRLNIAVTLRPSTGRRTRFPSGLTAAASSSDSPSPKPVRS